MTVCVCTDANTDDPRDSPVILGVSSHTSVANNGLVFVLLYIYTVFQKKFTLLLFAITKSDVDRFQ